MSQDAYQWKVTFDPSCLAIRGIVFEISPLTYSISPVALLTQGLVYALGDIWESAENCQDVTWINADKF